MSHVDQQNMRPFGSLKTVVNLRHSPLDVFKRICIAENYPYEMEGTNVLHASVSGLWCLHDITISWKPDLEQVHVFLAFGDRYPGGRSDDICRLMSLINERLPSGHFDFWSTSGGLVYRNTLSLRGGAKLMTEQAQDLIAQALDAAERGYPACQYVVWAGKSPEDALTSALVDLAAHP